MASMFREPGGACHNDTPSNNIIVRVVFRVGSTQNDDDYNKLLQWILVALRRTVPLSTWSAGWHEIHDEVLEEGTSPTVEFLFKLTNPKLPGFGSLCVLPPFHSNENVNPSVVLLNLGALESSTSMFNEKGKRIRHNEPVLCPSCDMIRIGVSGVPEEVFAERWAKVLDQEI